MTQKFLDRSISCVRPVCSFLFRRQAYQLDETCHIRYGHEIRNVSKTALENVRSDGQDLAGGCLSDLSRMLPAPAEVALQTLFVKLFQPSLMSCLGRGRASKGPFWLTCRIRLFQEFWGLRQH